ncbi:NAD(P)/FAD-dependent oxidoreductase [Reyranella sp. CPCC 100927]|uniref:FAD-dependent oxidoreductase n=1 Tax=Reyranella sp. CPCC 100927 TaxID=2599616 RepID=UPI0011B837F7|nr:NAD(P)/FAD-dependent oxidoreductase [Reyranella sp. CPCC 100927]TWT05037.1 FAD-dependent monooxygenase [Reyranella sp. CPCC 100927]
MTAYRIAVVGCGVGGMAVATLLAEAGHDVTVYERFAEPRPLGAGLLLQPTGLKVLHRLGIETAALEAGARIAGIDGRTTRGRQVLHLAYSDLDARLHGLGIHRGALFRLLFDRLKRSPATLVTASEVAAIATTATQATLRFTNRTAPVSVDLALVADGAHSALRTQFGIPHRAPVYPWGCLWVTLPDPQARFAGVLHQRFADSRVMVGALPVGRRPDDPAGTPCITVFWSLPARHIDAARTAGIAALKANIGRHWPDLAEPLADLRDMEQVAGATYRHVAMPRWSRDRVAFLGDCAHGTSPQLGQGANMALLDAATLASALAQTNDIASGLAMAEAARQGPTRFYRQASHLLTPFYQSHLMPLGWLRDLSFGTLCTLAPTRNMMLSTLAGVRRSWWHTFDLDADGRPDLPLV